MAYTPVNWQTGDTITADRLNRMDRGWDISTTELFSETVTTTGGGPYEGQFAYTGDLTAGTITVTYDGTEYVCPSIGAGEYGAPYSDGSPDFSVYPFNLFKDGDIYLTTQTAGEHTISVSVTDLQTSADFDAARGYWYVTGSPTELFSETVTAADNGSGMYIASLAYSKQITADTITVTYDGTEYTCPSIGEGKYGAPFAGPMGFDFSEFPFNLSTSGVQILTTQTAGGHTIAVTATVTSMQTSADFAEAVKDVASTLPVLFMVVTGITTWQQLTDAMLSNKLPYTVNSNAGGAHAYLFVETYIGTDAYYATAISVSSRTTSFTTMRLKAASSDSVLELA